MKYLLLMLCLLIPNTGSSINKSTIVEGTFSCISPTTESIMRGIDALIEYCDTRYQAIPRIQEPVFKQCKTNKKLMTMILVYTCIDPKKEKEKSNVI